LLASTAIVSPVTVQREDPYIIKVPSRPPKKLINGIRRNIQVPFKKLMGTAGAIIGMHVYDAFALLTSINSNAAR
jgi:hypothetical protein